MGKLVAVQDNKDYMRDLSVGAVINCNKTAFEAFLKKKHHKKRQEERISNMEAKLDNLTLLLSEFLEKHNTDATNNNNNGDV